METQSLPGIPTSLQTRVRNILLKPAEEWQVIATEPKDVAGLYRNYIMLLAAIPAVCGLIGTSVVGVSVPFIGFYRAPFVASLVNHVISYVFGLIGVYICALIVAKLGPTFQSDSDVAQALKLVAYGSTPMWVAGVLNILPMLALLGILAGLYGIYVVYLGMTPVMKTPADKVVAYMVVSAVVIIVVMFVVGLITAAVTAGIGFSVLPRATF